MRTKHSFFILFLNQLQLLPGEKCCFPHFSPLWVTILDLVTDADNNGNEPWLLYEASCL